jgi:hypothetical protein
MPGVDFFFVVNRRAAQADVPVTFRIQDRRPESWDPENGDIKPAIREKTDDGSIVRVELPAFGSVFVVFREHAASSANAEKPAEKTTEKSFSPIAIAGPWQVEFPKNSGVPPKTVFTTLKSWSESHEPGIRCFSGIAVYRTTFDCPESVVKSDSAATLDLGRVADVCEATLNGKPVGVGWHPPYRFDVRGLLVSGDNALEIRVANTWQNRLIGDASLPKSRRISRMTPESQYGAFAGKKLQKSGLLGPVRIASGTKTAAPPSDY